MYECEVHDSVHNNDPEKGDCRGASEAEENAENATNTEVQGNQE